MNAQAMPNPEQDLQPIPDWPAQRASSITTRGAPAGPRVDWPALHAALSQPFDPTLIRYRAGATNRDKTQAQALPYVDPRAYEDRLNQLVPGAWAVTFEPWGDHRIICRLTIHGITRSSTGEASDSPDGIAGTSAEAQAFKRACAKFGLGRHLYAAAPRWVPYDADRRCLVNRKDDMATRSDPNAAQPRPSEGIGHDRAQRMHRELQGLGLARSAHVDYAGHVLHRHVQDLAVLTPGEAAIVWRAAKRQAQGRNARRGTPASRAPDATTRDLHSRGGATIASGTTF